MSWQSYVDDQLLATNMVKDAIICDHQGNIWAKSSGINPQGTQLKTVGDNFSKADFMAMNGIKIDNVKYMYLRGDDERIRGKKGTGGIHIYKTNQAYIITTYEEPVLAEQCATVTEKLGEYLKGVGY